jgi:hypothetical protein
MRSAHVLVLLEVESPALSASLLNPAQSTRKARMHRISANAVILIVMRSHLWSAPIVAHFMSLALTALGC